MSPPWHWLNESSKKEKSLSIFLRCVPIHLFLCITSFRSLVWLMLWSNRVPPPHRTEGTEAPPPTSYIHKHVHSTRYRIQELLFLTVPNSLTCGPPKETYTFVVSKRKTGSHPPLTLALPWYWEYWPTVFRKETDSGRPCRHNPLNPTPQIDYYPSKMAIISKWLPSWK